MNLAMLLFVSLACQPDPVVDTAAPVPPDGPHACPVVLREPPMLGEDPEDLPYAVPHQPVLGDAPTPLRLRRSIHADPAVDATLMWQTDQGTLASLLRLEGPEGELLLEGVSFPAPDDSSRQHEIHICGLEPATSYGYRVGGRGAWSEPRSFTTAPQDPTAPLRLVVLGDSRDDLEVWAQVLALAAAHEPDLFLHTGDVVAIGGLQSLWDEWLEVSEPWLAEIPMLTVHGNHEFHAPNYYGSFAQPGNEQWYGIDWGVLHLTVLNDLPWSSQAAEQTAWLAADLAGTQRRWRIMSHHQPSWTDGNHSPNVDARDEWNPLLEAYAPHALVLAGHNHLYERCVPIIGEEQDPQGVTYVTTGGAGAPLYGTGSDWFLTITESSYHYMVIDIDSERLAATAYRLDGTVLDSFELPS
jgi:predicted phosphodiesterase